MDNDTEEGDNNNFYDDDGDDDIFVTHGPMPDRCRNENDAIQSIDTYLTKHYKGCPVFTTGSLQKVCEEALHSPIVSERRPVLVYIHHDKSSFSNIFCSKTFCSEIIIEYLLDNYVVWPWDITFESNKNTLSKAWKDLFSNQFIDSLSIEQCPMLIGIMQQTEKSEGWAFTTEYDCIPLLKYDTLTCTREKVTSETLQHKLSVFKKKFDENEQALVSSSSVLTIPVKVAIEITEYLALEDIIKTFSDKIIPSLRECKHLYDPSNAFIDTILRKIEPDQIVSLHLNTLLYPKYYVPDAISQLTGIRSLSLCNLASINLITIYQVYFPKLVCLSLWYDNEVDFNALFPTFTYLEDSIKRLEFHCGDALCTHFDFDLPNREYKKNSTVESFLIDISKSCLPSTYECRQHYESCFLMTIIQFIKLMVNIRHVHLITNECNLEKLLDPNQWKTLVDECHQLKTIKIEVWKSMLNSELSNEAMEVQKTLCNNGRIVKFQIFSNTC